MTSKDEYINSEDEWGRVLSNPNNVIVSDSLLGKLSLDELSPEIIQPKDVKIKCKVQFESWILEGALIKYGTNVDHMLFTITGPSERLANVIYDSVVNSILIEDNISNSKLTVTMLPEDDPVEIEFESGDEHNSYVTLIVKKTKE